MFIKSELKNNREAGVVLIVCLIVLLMLSLIGIASISSSNTEMNLAGNEFDKTGAFYAADAGLEIAVNEIIIAFEADGTAPSPLPYGSEMINDFYYTYSVTDHGPAQMENISFGTFNGLYGLTKTFDIQSDGFDSGSESKLRLEMGLKDVLIPVFQFAVFYENDLEISPGPNMTLGGRVHSNGDIYLDAGSSLSIDSYVTSSGSIFHGGMPGSSNGTSDGDVFIMDQNGAYQNMRNGDGTYLDATSSDWVNSSLSRWGGNVEDQNHGITQLYLPLVGSGTPTNMIDRGDGNPSSYENQAGLKFIDGVVLYLQGDGSWIDVTADLTTSGVIVNDNFLDQREIQEVYTTDIDVALLGSSGYFPSNGIIYYSQAVDGLNPFPAVRLLNGSNLPGPMTVASDNPIYTYGNYNNIDKQPAAFIGDALTILSGNWDDGLSSMGYNSRVATSTVVNAAYVTGNVASGEGTYSGGLENLPRFLEDWAGVEFTWRGSAVDLWASRQATALWSGNYYSPPIRNWGFDQDLLDPDKLPPGTPYVNVFMKSGWKQTIVYNYRRGNEPDSL